MTDRVVRLPYVKCADGERFRAAQPTLRACFCSVFAVLFSEAQYNLRHSNNALTRSGGQGRCIT